MKKEYKCYLICMYCNKPFICEAIIRNGFPCFESIEGRKCACDVCALENGFTEACNTEYIMLWSQEI